MYAKEAYFILFLKRLILNVIAFFRIKRLRLWSISIHLCYSSNTISTSRSQPFSSSFAKPIFKIPTIQIGFLQNCQWYVFLIDKILLTAFNLRMYLATLWTQTYATSRPGVSTSITLSTFLSKSSFFCSFGCDSICRICLFILFLCSSFISIKQ